MSVSNFHLGFSRQVFALFLFAMLAFAARAATLPNPGLTGTTSFDNWTTLTSARIPGYPGFPGAAPWPAPIASNPGSSGGGLLGKISGNAYPSSASIYTPSFSVSDFTTKALLKVYNVPVPNVKTVVFQAETGTALDKDFFSTPTLSYNDGGQLIQPTNYSLFSSINNGSFMSLPTKRNKWRFQWDLTAISDTITTISVRWGSAQHAQYYALRLDESNTYTNVVTPEPQLFASSSIAFPDVNVENSETYSTQSLVISNGGNAPLSISNIAYSGAYPGDYSIVPAPTFPINLSAGDVTTVTVHFTPQTPTASANRTANLDFTSNDPDGNSTTPISLGGNATPVELSTFEVD